MTPTPLFIAQDRSIAVPPGAVVKSGYVDVFKVRLACRERMAMGDIAAAYQKRLQTGSNQPWPCPTGQWDGETFILSDGRHEWMACVALGLTHLLVAWLEKE